jgi:truncated hemoglobin YjbI
MPTLYDELGGEAKLRAIIDRFVDRVVSDVMIGFFFDGVDRQALKRFEAQHAARLLGADVRYEGRPLREAHQKHRIMGGQFARRRQILKEVLEAERVPEHIRDAWLLHVDKLRPLITGQPDTQCD